jgi:LacI family transcriptional regulator
MAKPNTTLNTLAAELGVSATAVSLALRGRPGVSEKLRETILAAAKRHGYTPNVVAAELMAMVRAGRHRKHTGNLIAYVNTLPSAKELNSIPTFQNFFHGAVERGSDFGYRVERFDAHSPGMTGARLTQILKARGVRGVLVGARWYDDKEIDLDWAAFSVVLVGESEYGPNVYRVCNHHIHSTATCLKKLAERGYRRIGVALWERYESSRNYDLSLGVEQFRRINKSNVHAECLLYKEWDEKAFVTWMDENRLDAIISLEPEAAHVMERLRKARGQAPAYAILDVRPGSDWSGINQHSKQIGAAAMDLLRNLLLSGERGLVLEPRIMLIEGAWVDGATAPPVTAARATV